MTEAAHRPHLRRRIGLPQAIAMNMSQMCGIGPFITIPAMVVAFGGPQAIMGWVFGALLALCDGLVWAELGAAMPGSGGTYVYLREAFQYRTGRLMPFLFVWTAILFIPLIMSTGVYGFVSYLPLPVAGDDDLRELRRRARDGRRDRRAAVAAHRLRSAGSPRCCGW